MQGASVAHHHIGVGGTAISSPAMWLVGGHVYRGPVCTYV